MSDINANDAAVPETAETNRTTGPGKRSIRTIVAIVVLVFVLAAAAIGAYFYMDYADQWVITNNAQVEGRIYSVSSQIPGTLRRIKVSENTRVEKGALLATLDSRLQSLSIRKVEAAIKANNQTLQSLEQLLRAWAHPDVLMAKARQEELTIMLEEARLLFRKTNIFSPSTGYVAHMQGKEGEYVLPGQTIMSIVNLDDLWIVANFSEEQVRYIQVDQAADIFIDAYPGLTLAGRVQSIMPAGGSAFALFPPDATAGNWVRVTQRIPVKIVFDDPAERENLRLRIGMLARVRLTR